jgi:aspartyl-tRNA synthetase
MGATALRTHRGGSLTREHLGQEVRLGGWVHRRRDLGGLVFVDLRDRAGLVQLSFNPAWTSAEVMERAAALGTESVVLVTGFVALRPEPSRDQRLGSREVEVHATGLEVVGPAQTPAIPVARKEKEELPAEELRLRHRVLDLRRPELQYNLSLRHEVMQATRRYFDDKDFWEIETPILTKPTPEGARDYLVPSRVHPGEFFALPQSPQLYKQLLMIAGFDRYFQIARCFRDEDLRADRQPEFTQIDVEASFVSVNDMLELGDGLVQRIWGELGHPFSYAHRMRHADALELYGTDKPDLRYGLEIFDATTAFLAADFAVTRKAIETGGRVRGIRVPQGAALSRKQLDEIEAAAKALGAAGLLRLKQSGSTLEGPAAKYLSPEAAAQLGMGDGDLCLLVAAPDHVSGPVLDRVRQEVARRLDLIPEGKNHFVWIVDFPLFERDPATGTLNSVNHPFTAPHPEDIEFLESAPERVRALAYDMVLNGTELGGGSLRIADPALQRRVLALLGIPEKDVEQRFGFLLEGLRAGAPPHGGFAFGLDRIVMLLAQADSLRDVIAFPKTTAQRALFEGAPSRVDAADLRALHLEVLKSEK